MSIDSAMPADEVDMVTSTYPGWQVPADAAAIAGFLGKLLGCSVSAAACEKSEFAAGGAVVATYVDSQGNAEALFVCDLAAGVELALAASMLDTELGESAIRQGRVDGVLRERLYSFCEVIASLFAPDPIGSGSSQLELRDLADIAQLPEDSDALLLSHRSRIDAVISVADQGSGRVAFVCR